MIHKIENVVRGRNPAMNTSPKTTNTSPKTTKTYLKELDEKERLAFKIAKSHLGSSFHLEKSNGYQQYKKEVEK